MPIPPHAPIAPSRPRWCWWSSPSMPKGPAHSAGRLLGQNHHGLPFRLCLESILSGKKNFRWTIQNLSKTAPGILEYCGPGTKPPWGVDPPGPGRGEPGPPGPPGGPPGPLGIAAPDGAGPWIIRAMIFVPSLCSPVLGLDLPGLLAHRPTCFATAVISDNLETKQQIKVTIDYCKM